MRKATRPTNTQFDMNFDYDDWSRSAVAKSSGRSSTSSGSVSPERGKTADKSDVDFAASFTLDDDEDVFGEPFDIAEDRVAETPEKAAPSPPLFERSPVISAGRSASKKFKPKTPIAARLFGVAAPLAVATSKAAAPVVTPLPDVLPAPVLSRMASPESVASSRATLPSTAVLCEPAAPVSPVSSAVSRKGGSTSVATSSAFRNRENVDDGFTSFESKASDCNGDIAGKWMLYSDPNNLALYPFLNDKLLISH